MRRNLLGLFFCGCLLVPFLGGVAVLKWQKSEIRRTVKRKLMHAVDRSELVKLQLAHHELDQLDWEHSREFEYKGRMYDVVSTEEHTDSTTYWCWEDHEETALNRKLNELVALALGTNPTRATTQDQLILLLKTPSMLQHQPFYFSSYRSGSVGPSTVRFPGDPDLASPLIPPQG